MLDKKDSQVIKKGWDENLLTEIINYLNQNWQTFMQLIVQHLLISGYALVSCTLIGTILGYIGYQNKIVGILETQFFQLLRIIPSFAILVLLLPILGTGEFPTLIALFILGMPPILLNTMLAFSEISSVLLENAAAMGLTKRDILFQIQIPLALPTILSGIKTSSIEIVASATLASKIGAGGLGDLIFTGLGLNKMGIVFLGGLTVALFTLLLVYGIGQVEKGLLKYRK